MIRRGLGDRARLRGRDGEGREADGLWVRPRAAVKEGGHELRETHSVAVDSLYEYSLLVCTCRERVFVNECEVDCKDGMRING